MTVESTPPDKEPTHEKPFLTPLPSDVDPISLVELYKEHPALMTVEREVNHRLEKRRGIVSLIPKNAVGAEIGVFTGVFSEFLLAKTQPRKLFLIDPWHLLYGERFPKWGNYTAGGALTTAAALEAVRLRAAKAPGITEVVPAKSIDWLASVDDAALDWVYLDSSHQYEATLAELRAIEPKLAAGGSIFGDDAWTDRDNKHYGVFRAITEFCLTRPFELYRLDHNAQWALRRRLV